MQFPENLGAIACRCVIEQGATVGFVSHAGGDWQFYCSDRNHDFSDPQALKNELRLVHVAHLVASDASLNEVADLPIDMGAERARAGAPWTRFVDKDDE
jgi:hypothetical protein